jgi:hypothetical protein
MDCAAPGAVPDAAPFQQSRQAPAADVVAMKIPLGEIELAADIALPQRATGLVLFAHGSVSSRHSPRNRHVAEVLNRGAIGTVLLDLLTEDRWSDG